jgi:hypothetical protein
MTRRHIKTFLIWMVVLNWPPLLWLMHSDFLRLVCFGPYLFWINIPALWLGLAKLIGMPHYDIQEFGAMPLTPFSWFLIVVFWFFAAMVCTVATTFVAGVFNRRRETKTQTSNKADAIRRPANVAAKTSR